jgi:hypothetical protein
MYKTKIFGCMRDYSELQNIINNWYKSNMNILVISSNLSISESNTSIIYCFQITYKTIE